MFEKIEKNKSLNTLKNEHLKAKFSPIFVSIGNNGEHNFNTSYENNFITYTNYIVNVDFYGNEKELRENGVIQGGNDTYVMSSVDIFNKKSSEFIDCTGIIAVGTHKKTGKNISFLTHQSPQSFLSTERMSFDIDLRARLTKLRESSLDGSIDVVIFGGNYLKNAIGSKIFYKESIKLLNKILVDELGFEAVIVSGPKNVAGEDAIVFDTKNRRLFLVRSDDVDKKLYEGYLGKDLDEKTKEWDKN